MIKKSPLLLFLCIIFIFEIFIFWKGYYEGPKVFVFLLLSALLVLFWIKRILVEHKDIALNRSDFFYILWILTLIISGIFGPDPQASIIGGSYRHQGLIFFIGLWILQKSVSVIDKKEKPILNRVIAYTVVSETLIIFIQMTFLKTYFGKPLGTIGEANAVSGFLAIGSYYVFKYLNSVYFAIPVIGILIEQSRAGLLGLIPNMLVLASNFNSKIKKILLVLGAFTVFVSILLISNQKNFSPFENRLGIWKIALEEIHKRPLLGFGAESGEIVFGNYFKGIGMPLNGLIIDRAHNLFLDLLLWSGLPGLVTFASFTVLRFISLKNIGKKMALLSFLVYSMFQPVSIVHWLFLSLL